MKLKGTANGAIEHAADKLKPELKLHDIMKILVGASMLAIPTSLTEEVWDLGKALSWTNVMIMFVVEYTIIAAFILLESHKEHQKIYPREGIKRVLAILLLSAGIIGMFLALAGQLPLFTDTAVAVKRVIIGMLPASMSATVLDSL